MLGQVSCGVALASYCALVARAWPFMPSNSAPRVGRWGGGLGVGGGDALLGQGFAASVPCIPIELGPPLEVGLSGGVAALSCRVRGGRDMAIPRGGLVGPIVLEGTVICSSGRCGFKAWGIMLLGEFCSLVVVEGRARGHDSGSKAWASCPCSGHHVPARPDISITRDSSHSGTARHD